jgi:two-component system chemotaxis sensor kinase CheA
MSKDLSEDDIAMAKDFEQEAREMLDRSDENLKLISEGDWSHDNLLALFRSAHSLKGVSGMLNLHQVVEYVHKLETLMTSFLNGIAKPNTGDDVLLLTSFGVLRDLLHNDVRVLLQGEAASDADTVSRSQSALKEIIQRLEPQQQTAPATGSGASTETTEAVAKPGAAQATSKGPQDKTIRVDAETLDRLLNIVGELIVAKNKLRHVKDMNEESIDVVKHEIDGVSRDIEYFSSEIQRAVMRMRLVPIRTVFSKIPRIAAETSKKVGKTVDVHLEGADTDIDKGLVDSLFEPLVHIIRNSVDHGLESAEQRKLKGKSERGQIRVRARQEIDRVIVEVEDDGGGINADRVTRKAIEKGLITAEMAAAMKDQEKIELVFLPGFSTAEQLSEVSGRGVGMDVVRTTLRQIGGDVQIRSKLDVGTIITLETPAKTGIKEALLVENANSIYAVPVEHVVEAIKFSEQQLTGMSGSLIYRYRGQLIGLRPLSEILNTKSSQAKALDRKVLIVQKGTYKFGILVDSVLAKQQILIKDIPAQMKRNPMIKAATYLWDGKEILVLDPIGYVGSLMDQFQAVATA